MCGTLNMFLSLEIQEVGEATRPARASMLKAFESAYCHNSSNKPVNRKLKKRELILEIDII